LSNTTPPTPLNIPIRDYLDQTKYVTEELISLLNKVEEDWANIYHKISVIPMYQKNAQVYTSFAQMLRADGQPEESFDYVSRAAQQSKRLRSDSSI
jgi:hypothetical protein